MSADYQELLASIVHREPLKPLRDKHSALPETNVDEGIERMEDRHAREK